jgi:hypothetical protein
MSTYLSKIPFISLFVYKLSFINFYSGKFYGVLLTGIIRKLSLSCQRTLSNLIGVNSGNKKNGYRIIRNLSLSNQIGLTIQ